jgi:hypothetical protein
MGADLLHLVPLPGFLKQLFWFDLLPARATCMGHPMNKTKAWRAKSRSVGLAWKTGQKPTGVCIPLHRTKKLAQKGEPVSIFRATA